LSRFLCLKDDKGNPYEAKFLRDIVLNFAIAGRDTTGQLLSWTFYCLSLYPDVQKKLLEEIDNFNEEFSIKSVKSLNYLDNVVHETLRYFPSVPNTGRTVVQDDILPSGFPVKRGERMSMGTKLLHRNIKYWNNPDEYIPERWEDKDILKHTFQYIPFYGGPMVCLGKQLALLEAKVAIISLLRKYTFELNVKHKVIERRALILVAENGISMRVKKRN